MAVRRRSWESLSPAYKARLSRHGITRQAYEGGSNLSAARGHAATPEHGVKDALRNPGKYEQYIARKNRPVTPTRGEATPEDIAIARNEMLDRAYRSMRRFRSYIYYNDDTVRANVYGGDTSESGPVPGMDYATARWTAYADMEEIRSLAREQRTANPWFYH